MITLLSRILLLFVVCYAPRAAITTPSPRPNILVFFPDQLRHDWLNSGSPTDFLVTPHLDALRHQGLTFTRAIAPSPLCAPSRACFASISNFDDAGVFTNNDNFPKNRTTFYALLREAGYHTMAVGKLDLNKGDNLQEFGWGRNGSEHADEWGFSAMVNCAGKIEAGAETIDTTTGFFNEPYMEFLRVENRSQAYQTDVRARQGAGKQYTKTDPSVMSDEEYNDNWITNQALRLLKQAPRDREWFLIVNWNGPHPPMDITKRMHQTVQGRVFPPPIDPNGDYTPDEHNRIRANYAAMIENLDAQIGRILEAVNLKETLVVFGSDHGEMLGDKGLWGKQNPFQASIGVPLVIAGATDINAIISDSVRGTSSTTAVSLIDVARTFLDIGGVKNVPASMSAGVSLRPLLMGVAPIGQRVVKSGLGTWRLRFNGRYKLITGYNQELMLFDLKEDPYERHNLITGDRLPQKAIVYEQVVDAILTNTN